MGVRLAGWERKLAVAERMLDNPVPGPRFACCPLHLTSGNLKKVSDIYIKVGGLFLEKGRISAKALGWGHL